MKEARKLCTKVPLAVTASSTRIATCSLTNDDMAMNSGL